MDLYSVEYWKNWKKNYKYTESCVDLEEDKNVKVLNRFQEERRLAKLAQKLRNEKLQANYEQSLMEKEAKEKAYQLKMNPALSTKRKTYQGFISNSHMKSDSFLDRGYSAVRSETSTVSLQPVERISKFVPAKDSPKMATFGQSTRKDWEVKTTKDRMQAGPGSYSLENVGALSEHANASTSTFSNASKMQTSSNETPGAVYSPHYDAIKRTAAAIQFPSAERLGEQQVESTPGPKYNIPSGFHKMNPLPDAVMEVSLGQQDPTYQESPAQVEFGFGCSIQEHIQYGKCLDGKCLNRGNWETSTGRALKNKTKAKLKKAVNQVPSEPTLKQSALHTACLLNHLSIVKHLVNVLGEDINVQNSQKATPLHIACEYGYVRIVTTLLDAPLYFPQENRYRDKANLDLQDVDGNTCLHLAAKGNYERIVLKLLEKKSSITLLNNKGLSCLKVCGRNQAIYQILRAHSISHDLTAKLGSLELRKRVLDVKPR